MEVHRFDLGHNFPAEGSLFHFYRTVAYENYFSGRGGVEKYLAVALVLIVITWEGLDLSDETKGGFRKVFHELFIAGIFGSVRGGWRRLALMDSDILKHVVEGDEHF